MLLTNSEFNKILTDSGMLHWRILPQDEDSMEARLRAKPVENSLSLWDGEDSDTWAVSGLGSADLFDPGDGGCLRAHIPSRADRWPEGEPQDGDYTAFGQLNADLIPAQHDWRPYNRLHFEIMPCCRGMHSPMIAIQLYNDGEEKIPDRYHREGYHTIHLRSDEWNDCIWEFPALPRDHVTHISFIFHSYGKELSMDDAQEFLLRNIRLEYTPVVSHTLGWQCDQGQIVYPTNGYFTEGEKNAVTSEPITQFQLVHALDDTVIYAADTKEVINEKGDFRVLDFTCVREPGVYYLASGDLRTETFPISVHPLYQAMWKGIHFLYCERCGYPVGRGHGICHTDILAKHGGVTLPYCGGWHDAGDVSQQTLQTAEVTHAVLEAAQRIKEEEPALYMRMMEEASWGLDFVLRMRFGDGFRATSAGIRRWSDGLIGNFDDTFARVHDHAFENFLMAGVEAYAAKCYQELDPPLSDKCRRAAMEDFRFAQKVFAKRGMELPIFFEHTFNSGLSQYYATACWAASLIYDCSEDRYFASVAASFGEDLLKCQETARPGLQGSRCPVTGFFYRDQTHRQIVHFNHQARPQIFVQAILALVQTQPEHPRFAAWERSLKLYAQYLKGIYPYASPYGMLPAGVHRMDEHEDQETFPLLHLMTTWEEDHRNYLAQLKSGIRLSRDYCLRMFPVWFSFRGNAAIHLSEGKAATLLGRYFHDDALLQIGREQLYWIFGKNPFGQSLMYGEGNNFPQQYGALNGEMVGSMPVGIETRGNDDVPFWPIENNATYKEVWTTSIGRFFWLAADLY